MTDNLAKRKDLTGFFNSLFAGSVAFGLSTFYNSYHDLVSKHQNLSFLATRICPFVALLAALANIFDDWRRARWLAEDYGYRLSLDAPLWRFWIHCGQAITAFFVTATAFSMPYVFPFLLAGFYVQSFAWLWCLSREIRRDVDQRGVYPTNSLGLTKTFVDAMGAGKDPASVDYRINDHASRMAVAIGLFLGAAGLVLAIHRINGGQKAAFDNMAVYIESGVPLLVMAALKRLDSKNKRRCLERMKASTLDGHGVSARPSALPLTVDGTSGTPTS